VERARSGTDDKAFLGVGWGFPVALDARGEVGVVAHEEDVRQAVRIILGTNHGERVMRPDFGANLRALVFEPLSATTMSLVQEQVRRALIEWEPRIDVLDVRVMAGDADRARGRLQIEIDYRVRSTNTFYNLVYPFYLLEGTPT
jgi:phage baseplate assembly protein W